MVQFYGSAPILQGFKQGTQLQQNVESSSSKDQAITAPGSSSSEGEPAKHPQPPGDSDRKPIQQCTSLWACMLVERDYHVAAGTPLSLNPCMQ
jgi:hypothetical protein